jgi:hypothetical protein
MDAPSVLMSIRLDGGLPTELARSVGLAGGSWSRDGYIYVDGLGRTLLRIPESGGAAADAATPDSASGEEEINMPFALPNGRGVIVTIHRSYQSDSWMVGVLDTRTGKHRQLMPGVAGYYLSSGHLLVVNTQGELSAVPFDQNSLEITGDPTVIDRNINIAGWRVDMGAGEDVVAYALESTAQDSLELGWTTGDASYQPVAPGWVDAITSFSPSPDGKSIAFSVARERPEVWIRRLDNGALTRLSLGSAFVAGQPDRLLLGGPGQVAGSRGPPRRRKLRRDLPGPLLTLPLPGNHLRRRLAAGLHGVQQRILHQSDDAGAG